MTIRATGGVGRSLIALAVAKVAVLAYGVIVAVIVGGESFGSPYDVLHVFEHWDAAAYLAIARDGYHGGITDRDLAFYPLFPALVGATARLFGDALIAGFAIATLASALAVAALYFVAREDENESTAQVAVLLLLVFPTSFVLHIPYSEGLFIALVLGAFLTFRRDRFLAAGALGALAAFTRANGIVVLFALLAEAFLAFRRDRAIRGGWAWLGLVPLGTAAYLLVNEVVAGDPLRFATLLRIYWDKAPDWPWVGPVRLLEWSIEASPARAIWITELVFTAIAIIATVAVARTLRLSYAVWMAGNTLLFISTGTPLSVPRYALSLFPMFIVLGRTTWVRRRLMVVVVPSVVLLCLLSARFVLGQWAF